MATTHTNENQPTPPVPFSEEDKLGPLGNHTKVLHSEIALRGLLVHEFRAAADAARGAAARVDHGTTEAVHVSRKALRRARAILELIAGALPKSERKAVKRALQEARRALSTIRDHAVAPDTFAGLDLDDDDRAAGKKVLDNAAEAMPAPAEIKQLLAESAARAAAQVEALEASLPAELGWSTIRDGLERVYRRARAARKHAKKSATAFHAWRRRSKELVYQLELLSAHAGHRAHALHEGFDGIADTLSGAVDLIMLREFVETYGQGVTPEAIDHLQRTIDKHLEDLMVTARKTAAEPFEDKPRRFAKKVGKAVRRDLAPAHVEAPQRD